MNKTLFLIKFRRPEVNLQDANLFFLPTSIRCPNSGRGDFKADTKYWLDLDNAIQVISRMNLRHFSCDRVIIPSVPVWRTPIITLRELGVQSEARFVTDSRFLRLDNSLTPNGRDIFVPYLVDTNHYKPPPSTNSSRRDFLFFAICNDIKFNEFKRRWRLRAREQLTKLKATLHLHDVIVEKSVSSNEFDHYMQYSDFCFILPGDTASTAKLYKAK
jgi:hypothetical protein